MWLQGKRPWIQGPVCQGTTGKVFQKAVHYWFHSQSTGVLKPTHPALNTQRARTELINSCRWYLNWPLGQDFPHAGGRKMANNPNFSASRSGLEHQNPVKRIKQNPLLTIKTSLQRQRKFVEETRNTGTINSQGPVGD